MKCLNRVYQEHASKIAIIDAETEDRISYTGIAALKEALLRLFPQPHGNLIFLQATNSCFSAATALALLSSNNTICLLDPSLESEIFEKYRSTFSPDVIISDQLTNTPIVGYNRKPHPNSQKLYICSIKENTQRKIPAQLRAILPTSGSTGSMKFVKLSEENLSVNSQDICNSMQISATDRAYAHLPLHYSYGLSVLISHALAGATSVVTSSSIIEKRFWREIKDYNCNYFPGVPFHFEILLKFGIKRLNIPSLNRFSVAGGALGEKDQEQLLEQLSDDMDLYVLYGQTEASPRITTLNLKDHANKLGSVGRPIGAGRITINSDYGEIILIGSNVMMGYASRREDLYKPDEMQSRLATGDIGYLDDEGFLYITGRLKRFAKLYGLRFNMDDIQTRLSFICPCMVVEKENTLHVAIDRHEMIDQLKLEITEVYKIPGQQVKFHQLNQLPRLSSDKLDYQALSEMI
ncbi:AMP-binding protein [Kiloniella antarctica]|uniref:AMP-binding protein n=1 Tax=Kiloniella antarctica TaxID=1550907 RepID=A0ABW5BP32_9PROT